MSRTFWRLGLAIFVGIGCSGKAPPEPILVGHVAVLSGPDRAAGEHARQAILMAVEESNREASQSGARQITVIHADSRGETEGSPAAVRLVTINKVSALLGGTDPSQMERLGAVAQAYNVVLVGPVGLAGPASSTYVFRTGLSPALKGRVLARFATEELKVREAFILLNNMSNRPAADKNVSSAVGEAFSNEYRKRGKTVAGEGSYKTADELREWKGRLPQGKQVVVVIAGAGADLRTFGQPSLEKTTSLLFAGGEEVDSIRLANGLPGMTYLPTAFVEEKGSAKEFAQKYQDRFREPPDIHAALAYDNARILFEGIRQATPGDGAKARETLAGLKNFPTLFGPGNWDANLWAVRPAFVVGIQGHEIKQIKRYDPE